jgi:transposase
MLSSWTTSAAQAIRAAIRAAGALLLFLPAYSPDPNPIEQVFAKIKALLRKSDARSIEDVDAALGPLLDRSSQTNVPDTSAPQAIGQPQASRL